LVVPTAARAQDGYFGPQVGFFFPASKVLRDELGESWLSFGISKVRNFERNQSDIAYDFNAISQSRNGSRVFILSGSIGWVAPLAAADESTQPYAALRGGLAYFDFAVDTPSGRKTDSGVGINANAALGVTFSGRFNIEARYDVWNSQQGISFNGLTLAARLGLARF
jgi:hypothetical protein